MIGTIPLTSWGSGKACLRSVRIYEILDECRDYGIKVQVQGTSVSIASNIAEGSEREGRDIIWFLRISRRCCDEIRIQPNVASKIKIIDALDFHELIDESKPISKMLRSLRKSIIT